MTAKVYVDVLAVFSREGELIPTAFVWEDGRKYAIDKVSKPDENRLLSIDHTVADQPEIEAIPQRIFLRNLHEEMLGQ